MHGTNLSNKEEASGKIRRLATANRLRISIHVTKIFG